MTSLRINERTRLGVQSRRNNLVQLEDFRPCPRLESSCPHVSEVTAKTAHKMSQKRHFLYGKRRETGRRRYKMKIKARKKEGM
jgi:hypothetical protein